MPLALGQARRLHSGMAAEQTFRPCPASRTHKLVSAIHQTHVLLLRSPLAYMGLLGL